MQWCLCKLYFLEKILKHDEQRNSWYSSFFITDLFSFVLFNITDLFGKLLANDEWFNGLIEWFNEFVLERGMGIYFTIWRDFSNHSSFE